MKKIVLLIIYFMFAGIILAQDMTKCVFFQNNWGDLMYGNTLRGKSGRLFSHIGDGLVALNTNNDFQNGVNIGTQATFKDHGMILGQQRVSTGNDGEVDRLFITPYRHIGTWRFSSRDIGGNAFLDLHYSSSKNLLVIQHQGHIGVGVANPKHRLEVNGTIRAKEVKIEATGWADFVFAEDYKLLALSDVESHIKEHKHLPDIPSEKDVKENGIDVGEMQIKLLQKIEELTLYVISQNKEISNLKDEVHNLKNK